jgi:hypothetical protein
MVSSTSTTIAKSGARGSRRHRCYYFQTALIFNGWFRVPQPPDYASLNIMPDPEDLEGYDIAKNS